MQVGVWNRFYNLITEFPVLQQSITGGEIFGLLSNILGDIPEEEIEGFFGNFDTNTMEVVLDCKCKETLSLLLF